MYRILLLCMMQYSWVYAYAQRDANWVFGDSVKITFSPEFEISSSSITSNEACASISDTLGNLLFYTNGETVWSFNDSIMENGEGLKISATFGGGFPSSITQGVIILPTPGIKNLFYIMHSYSDTMFFSIVDRNMDDYLGAVLDKNHVFFSTFFISEKMTAVRHANGRDWWLLIHEWPDVLSGEINFIFDKFLITSYEILGPYQQVIGSIYDPDNFDPSIGQMKFNQEGNMLAVTSGKNVDLYDFDRCTGELSSWVQIPNVQGGGTYGCEFSPDGTKLYIGGYGSDLSTKVIQYCLDCEEEIPDTKEIIFQNIYNDYGVGQFQLAPDGKIYITLPYWGAPNYVYSEVNTHLCVINNPNEVGLACDFDTLTIDLNSKRTLLGLPNMVNYNLGALTGSPCDTITSASVYEIENKNEFMIYPNPANDFISIQSKLSDITNINIEIFSASGGKLLEKHMQSSQLNIPIDAFPKGIYFVLVKQNGLLLYSGNFMKE